MYQPERYAKNDLDFAEKLIRNNPFGEFILQGERLLATHIPILIDDDSDQLRLFAHIANHNPQKEYLTTGREALLIFHGLHDYVSSSWYHEKDISTWDYSAVHVNCKIIVQEKEELDESLKSLVHHFEKNREKPMEFDQIPASIINDNLPGITGFWCEPTHIEGIGKWHQGFNRKDIISIVEHLGMTNCPFHNELIRDIKQEHDL